jgi:hypothetical protein
MRTAGVIDMDKVELILPFEDVLFETTSLARLRQAAENVDVTEQDQMARSMTRHLLMKILVLSNTV